MFCLAHVSWMARLGPKGPQAPRQRRTEGANVAIAGRGDRPTIQDPECKVRVDLNIAAQIYIRG